MSGTPHHCNAEWVYGSLQRAPPHHVRLLLIRMMSIDTSGSIVFSFQGDLDLTQA